MRLRRAAERFQVSPATAARWAARYRQAGAPSTVHAVLRRYACPPLAHLDRAAGVPVRLY